jgi:hypothetical protein
MADFTLKRESIEEIRDYNVEETKYENEVRDARLLTSGMLLGFKIKSPILTYTKYQDYITFFNGKYGSLTSFTIDSPFDGVTYTVKFSKGSFKSTYSGGVFQCEFSLERVF